MQRCPYIYEMKERLLREQRNETLAMESFDRERDNLLENTSRPGSHQVGTVVKLNQDGYHTSPTHQRTPLVPRDLGENFNLDHEEEEIDPRKPKNAKTSLFIVTSLVYALLLIVVCIAYVISDVTTHQLPIMYYEGFFTYLYGASILFLLYVFCFLLQESTCCNSAPKQPKPPKQKKVKKEKAKKGEATEKADGKDGKAEAKGSGKDKEKTGKPSPYQETQPEAEAALSPRQRRRKTTQDAHGSFFLRVGAIGMNINGCPQNRTYLFIFAAFGLGTMIYIGLEFGTFFEIPFTSPCHQILRGVNPLLQMIFTFMQMYFVFMNSRLNIHRFKVLARFGLMHVFATNICVWIRTMVLESLKELTVHYQLRGPMKEDDDILESLRVHTLRNAGMVMGSELGPAPLDAEWINSPMKSLNLPEISVEDNPGNILSRIVKSTAESVTRAATTIATTTTTTQRPTTTTAEATTVNKFMEFGANAFNKFQNLVVEATTTTTTTTRAAAPAFEAEDSGEDLATTTQNNWAGIMGAFSSAPATTPETKGILGSLFDQRHNLTNNIDHSFERLDSLFPQSLIGFSTVSPNGTSCERVNIMGTIVQDSTPYLYPFVIEYSLIGAAVIYVMWKHIGRYPKYTNEEDLEHRLEVMLSRRAVALAQSANSGRVDCVGASKGLFFGLLLLVGSLICLILFFVLVRHEQFRVLAYYLADASHSVLMILAILAILIGFIRVQNLKFRCEEQSSLNDILLRISAFGLFVYSVFSVIAGALNAHKEDQNLLVTIVSAVAILQVVLQLLFIADVSRRRVHLPEHDRSKPGRQIVTFLLICNVSMFAIYTFDAQKVFANPVQSDFYGFISWALIQRVTLPLCIFHRFHSAVTLAEVWKTTYKARLE
ncbi:unnamed protein product [Diamesa serratosioi]